ncbi:MAG: hypothetical protein ABIO76_00400 [Ginsengibacter sp.]
MFFYRKEFMLICLLFSYNNVVSQVFGGNPRSIKWRQINTPAARIIFPTGLDSSAARIASVIDFIKAPTETTIGVKSKKINIVLQNHTTVSNGYVSLGPYKSEFYLTPSQNSFELGSLPWLDQLTIHEYRHVQQYNNFDVGLSRVLHVMFGEEGQALANNAAIPNWFFEGDAVYNETNVSKQGRGSLPFFYNGYRSLWNGGKHYNWMKLRNGSYRDFVPNHYELGYQLVAYGREKYGDKFWKNVTHDAASFKGIFYPFQKAIKKYSGIDYVNFRNDAIEFFKKQFDLQVETTVKRQAYVNEEYPVFKGNSIIYVKSGYKQIPEFVIRTGEYEKKLRVRDNSLDNQFSLRNDKIIYASYRLDVRWGYRDYNDLKILDITNGEQQTLTSHTRYFSPDISEDGGRVVAVDESITGEATVHILNAVNGRLVKVIPNPTRLFYTYPKFFRDSNIISAVRDINGKMSLAEIDIQTGDTKYLTPFSYNVIGFPCIYHDTIYFTNSLQKNDELFAYTVKEKKVWKIVYKNGPGLGKYQPAVNDPTIAWSTATADGFKLVNAPKTDVEFQEVTPGTLDKNTSSFGITSLNNTNSNLLYSVPDDSYTSTTYSKAFRLFNFHSIEPTMDDPQYTITLLSENILNTLQSQFSFTYNRAEEFKKIGFQTVYGGWFPFLSAGINSTIDRRKFNSYQKAVYFNELEPYAGFSIPLNLSKGHTYTFLNFGSQYVYNESDYKGVYKDSLGNISYSYINSFLSLSNQIQKAKQQIFPRFAQALNLSYKSALTHYEGYQFVVNGNIYLPGFMNTHSIVLNGAFLIKDSTRQISFSSAFPFSRGYQAANFYNMYKWGVNYHLPLFYPDAGFGNIFYLLRVRANIFYDHTYVNDFLSSGNSFNAHFKSVGAEINFDTKWWNQANVSVGLRYSYLMNKDLFGNTGSNRWEIILPVNIFNQ